MTRIAVLCPGRGSYTARSLGSLPREQTWVATAEELRKEYGLPSLLELDGAAKFRPELHLRADNASALIYVLSMLDARAAMQGNETVCVAGNSMGWYTALAVAGALSFEEGFRLVQEMALLQMEHTGGGQILYPVVDEQWRPDPGLDRIVARALESSGAEAFWSIHLGGYAVLAGSERGVRHLLDTLVSVQRGQTTFPYRLRQHGPYHTPLLGEIAQKAAGLMGRLGFGPPRIPLIDGRGAGFTPWSTRPADLAAYTLGAQVTTPYDFTTSVRVVLREYAPEKLALPGPGNTLGGVCGQILVAERWQGIDSRDAFETGPELVWSLRR